MIYSSNLLLWNFPWWLAGLLVGNYDFNENQVIHLDLDFDLKFVKTILKYWHYYDFVFKCSYTRVRKRMRSFGKLFSILKSTCTTYILIMFITWRGHFKVSTEISTSMHCRGKSTRVELYKFKRILYMNKLGLSWARLSLSWGWIDNISKIKVVSVY